MPRIYCPTPLEAGAQLSLPSAAARHVQVLRLQPGDGLTLFNGEGGEFAAEVTHMGRTDVAVQVGAFDPVERETARAVHLAVVMPSNERMDWLVEKASELGAASIAPLMAERSVLRLSGERASKKQAHWQAIAVAAAEQCGRNRVPRVHAVCTLAQYLEQAAVAEGASVLRCLLTPGRQGHATAAALANAQTAHVLSGPEGGLSPAEEERAMAAGFVPLNLGARVLRAETAPLVALVRLGDYLC